MPNAREERLVKTASVSVLQVESIVMVLVQI